MKTCLIQHASGDEWRSLLYYALGWHYQYCQQHNIDYLVYSGEVQTVRVPNWNWLPLARLALQLGNELVVVMDTDSIIVDRLVDLREAASEFEHVGSVHHPHPWKEQDWHYNLGVTFLKNTRLANKLLLDSDLMGEVPGPCGWHVQSAVLETNDRMGGIISQVSDRWNSSKRSNECKNPVIKSWHGLGGPGRIKEIMGELARLTACKPDPSA